MNRDVESALAAMPQSPLADIERRIEEEYRRPDIHTAVAAMFDDAIATMQPSVREEVARCNAPIPIPGKTPS
ncbi:hypothetical protein [Noviherbaspirillum sp.]|uniref:hypothetical protein n=1 Tax=Noviherbaspirillum sp. TaxID=1926288 RepID=UPI0025FB55AD|nr:hypothetical protein [Noviherbaspirillum sp.]